MLSMCQQPTNPEASRIRSSPTVTNGRAYRGERKIDRDGGREWGESIASDAQEGDPEKRSSGICGRKIQLAGAGDEGMWVGLERGMKGEGALSSYGGTSKGDEREENAFVGWVGSSQEEDSVSRGER
ncbi:hypothetical protein ACLOJK_010057 [Asimina triloba]